MARVEIDTNSGFCNGVVRAIQAAEQELEKGEQLYCLGDIVHNSNEVERLRAKGLITINHDELRQLRNAKVLLRAHGEPPETYRIARENNIEIIDATCPVVARLQRRVREAYAYMSSVGGRVVLLGKRGHAEVIGLTGQVNDDVTVVERLEDIDSLDFSHPIHLLSQTTQSIELFNTLANTIRERMDEGVEFIVTDTICRRVAGREPLLADFSKSVDLVLFVCGKKSSNGKVLSEVCRKANPRCYNIEEPSEIEPEWLAGVESIGICGATSTPRWLMEQVAERVAALCQCCIE